LEILAHELSVLYRAFSQNKSSPLPELPIQYADFAVWQRQWLQGEELTRQLSYWQRQLGGELPVLDLPTDRPRPAVQTSQNGATKSFLLPANLSEKLKALSKHQDVTLFMTLLAAFQTMLFKFTGQQDIIIGSPIANRNRAESDGLIGFFVNTLALRTDLSGNPAFTKLLARVKETTLKAYANQDLPFEMLVEKLHPKRDLSRTPLFQVMFVFQDFPADTLELPGLTVNLLELDKGTSLFDVTLFLRESEQGLSGSFEYNTDLFDSATIERMIGHFRTLLEGLVVHPEKRLSDLPILTESERNRILVDWNATESAYPKDKFIHQLFEDQVERTPDAVAVVYEERSLTYEELNRQANRLARHLITLGVAPDAKVAICVERSVEMVVGLLAILKAGGAYVPLDPAYPAQRLEFMLEDSAPIALLTQSALKERWENLPEQVAVIELDAKTNAWAKRSATNPSAGPLGLMPQHLAYVIYTSGSTGKPKGVMVEHAGLSNYIYWTTQHYTPCQSSIVSSSLAFDATVTSLYSAIVRGGRMILLKQGDEIEGLEEIVATYKRDSLVKITPAHLEILGNRLESKVVEDINNTFVVGGEALSPSTVEKWQRLHPKSRIVNEYGPTETVVGCVVYEVQKDFSGAHQVPIGRPIANTRIYILDQHRKPVPLLVPGELYIGGAGVARGYLNRHEQTAERFLSDPFVDPSPEEPNPRMYKTGDLGRFLPDGTIEFLGRNDFQVKIRGFRIELGEIEARLVEIDSVNESAVIAKEGTPGDMRLIAYYTGSEELTVESLRTHLSGVLPEYMVPAAFVRLEALPLTPNGKLDRKALPAPEGDAFGARVYEAPQGEVEERLAAIWAELLQIETIGRHDNFFELGGHSLLAIQLESRIRQEFSVSLEMQQLFMQPTIESCGECIINAQLAQFDSDALTELAQTMGLGGKELVDL
jgi:amino acid adenylation domain-containing protein